MGFWVPNIYAFVGWGGRGRDSWWFGNWEDDNGLKKNRDIHVNYWIGELKWIANGSRVNAEYMETITITRIIKKRGKKNKKIYTHILMMIYLLHTNSENTLSLILASSLISF